MLESAVYRKKQCTAVMLNALRRAGLVSALEGETLAAAPALFKTVSMGPQNSGVPGVSAVKSLHTNRYQLNAPLQTFLSQTLL